MKKCARLLSVLLTLVMVLGLAPAISIPALAAEETIHVSTAEDFKAAINTHEGTDTPYTICLDNDITIGRTNILDQQLTLDLCGAPSTAPRTPPMCC